MKANEILTKSQENVKGLLITNQGLRKEKIYKKEIFSEMSNKEKKEYRKRLRKHLQNLLESIIFQNNAKAKTNLDKLCKDFQEFYTNVYQINNYSVSSLCSENSKHKDLINNALSIIKENLKIK